MVYGSTREENEELRERGTGKLRVDEGRNGDDLLPFGGSPEEEFLAGMVKSFITNIL